MRSTSIAGVVAERVVDLLEAVEVHVDERDRAAMALRVRDRAVELFVEQPAVGEIGELVVVGLVASCSRIVRRSLMSVKVAIAPHWCPCSSHGGA